MEPLDELYFQWLYGQVVSIRLKNPNKTYWSLLRQMHEQEFVWFVPNDDNRVEDGRDLRHQFMADRQLREVDEDWLCLGCSFLEMLVALSRRLAFETEGKPAWWFFHLIDNLGINFVDSEYNELIEENVGEVLYQVIWRIYNYDGTGGLFPLVNAGEDQREVEIWYQFNAYLMEKFE